MIKKILLVVGAILVIGLVAVSSFFGGMRYEANRASQVQAAFFEGRGGQPGAGQFPGGGQMPADGQLPGGAAAGGQGAFPGGRGVTGEVKTNDGQVITVSTAEDITTVQLNADTQIQMTVDGASEDLQPGTRVRIIGETGDDGTVSATQIVVIDDTVPVMEP